MDLNECTGCGMGPMRIHFVEKTDGSPDHCAYSCCNIVGPAPTISLLNDLWNAKHSR